MKKNLCVALLMALAGPAGLAQTTPQPPGMVRIKAKDQSFLMGWAREEVPDEWACYIGKHKVTFTRDFHMDVNLVTQEDYLALIGNNPSAHTGDLRLPVEKVSWYDAVLYCNARSKRDQLEPAYTYTEIVRNGASASDLKGLTLDLKKSGYRLPTNSEYEYTERNGLEGTYFFTTATDGKEIDAAADAFAWSKNNSGGKTQPVGTKKPHPTGVHDLIGNLFEWCHDWEGPYQETDQVDPVGPPDGKTECGKTWLGSEKKVAKGGSYKTDVKGHMRINYHFKWPPASTSGEVGFRCVRTAE